MKQFTKWIVIAISIQLLLQACSAPITGLPEPAEPRKPKFVEFYSPF